MKVAIYGRVSTADGDQNPESQLIPLREFTTAQEWSCFMEYVDHAPATDLARRTSWRRLLEDASRRRFDLVLVWRYGSGFPFGAGCCHHFREAAGLGSRAEVLLRALAGHHLSLRRGPLLHHRGLRPAGAGES